MKKLRDFTTKRFASLNLLVVAVLLLTWATPSFCPLTFVQANTLKNLPKTADNLAKIKAAVEAAGPKDRSGLNVLAKAFGLGTSASKEEILAAIDSITPIAAPVVGGGSGAVDVASLDAAHQAEVKLIADTAAAQAALAAAQAAVAKIGVDEEELCAVSGGSGGGATRSGCLTFVQANTLKSLPRTSKNLDLIIAAVRAAGPKDRSGLSVLAKAFDLSTSASKEDLLAKLQEAKASVDAAEALAVASSAALDAEHARELTAAVANAGAGADSGTAAPAAEGWMSWGWNKVASGAKWFTGAKTKEELAAMSPEERRAYEERQERKIVAISSRLAR